MTATHIVAACLGVAILVTIGVFVWQLTSPQPDPLLDDTPDGSTP
jgi:hypothetical protein